ncbi:MAG: hypothetical protein J5662_00810 [Clostridia bacterium]|nr:hypothetical protein [Clostridia bacterium]
MAYPYPYYNSYMGNYYAPQSPYIAPQAQGTQQPINIPTQAQNAPTAQNNGLIWVQGETGAKSYMIPPNSTVLLMDSEAQRFYLKSVDLSGMPSMRIFEYSEIPSESRQNAPESTKAVDMDKYITKEEFERRLAEIAPKAAKKKSEVIGDE